MKKVINRKTYDTDKAKAVGKYDNGNPLGSPVYFGEVLYVTENGEYFLHGKGGAMTHYAKQSKGRCNTSDEAIIPMTENQAKDWTMRCCDREKYNEIFGENADRES